MAIPITVLEELDKFKIGNDTKNFAAREVIRFIDSQDYFLADVALIEDIETTDKEVEIFLKKFLRQSCDARGIYKLRSQRGKVLR